MFFQAQLEKDLARPVSNWEVIKFQPIPNPTFPGLYQPSQEDLSSDQYYSYRIAGQ